jgi:hypothetical protein
MECPSALKAERSEMPVMMPGRAIGRMTSSEMVSRPKNFDRDRRRQPACRAPGNQAVAMLATLTESHSASQMSSAPGTTPNH